MRQFAKDLAFSTFLIGTVMGVGLWIGNTETKGCGYASCGQTCGQGLRCHVGCGCAKEPGQPFGVCRSLR